MTNTDLCMAGMQYCFVVVFCIVIAVKNNKILDLFFSVNDAFLKYFHCMSIKLLLKQHTLPTEEKHYTIMDFSAGVHDVICTRKINFDLG